MGNLTALNVDCAELVAEAQIAVDFTRVRDILHTLARNLFYAQSRCPPLIIKRN